jgi:hypothetical protein
MSNVAKAVEAADTKPAKTYRWVEIPERDMYDHPHPGVGINLDHYGPGRHYVEEVVAGEIERILKRFEIQNIRLLQPRKDMTALNDLAKTRGSDYVDKTTDNSKA